MCGIAYHIVAKRKIYSKIKHLVVCGSVCVAALNCYSNILSKINNLGVWHCVPPKGGFWCYTHQIIPINLGYRLTVEFVVLDVVPFFE